MAMLFLLLVGAVLGALFVILARALGVRQELRLYAIGLVVAALLYVFFVRHHPEHLLLELLGLAGFGFTAVMGVRRRPALLGFAWLAHAAWDAVLHWPAPAYVPWWYPPACLTFDVVVGLYLLAQRTRFR